MKKISQSHLLSGLRINALVGALFAVLVVSIVLLLVNFIYTNKQSSYDKEYISNAGELRVLSQSIAKDAAEAASGKVPAFALLNTARNDFTARWDILVNGDPSTGLPPAPPSLSDKMDAVGQYWDQLSVDANVIVQRQPTVMSLYKVAATLADTIPQLQVEYEEIVDILLQADVQDARQISVAQRQALLAERIIGSANKILAGGENSIIAADMFVRDAELFERILQAMLRGDVAMQITKVTDDEAIERLNEIVSLFKTVSGSVEEIMETSPELFQVSEAATNAFNVSQTILDEASALEQAFVARAESRGFNTLLGYILGSTALASIILIGLVNMRETRVRLAETADTNERNQTAILRLLDEIGDLADGDLTAEATVTEDFTGAIADSINFTIDQLRDLVGTINGTAVQVAAAAQETQSTAIHLAEASEHQAQEIAGASAAINEMAVSIDQVSANAAESSAVAERSVSIANKGSEVVHNTITGMDNIREQIQDTSKRIKRLGESSQEIGDIVSLINDIADQTNILALNAAIQASMAGDAGRGFAVVADEVQRLAERSSSATKQIEALVKTIQADTNEAVISMEQTTAEVVRGAHLAQDAGVSLEEIEKVSKALAALIQNISNAARQQASSAGHISSTMNVIQEITSQTSAGTTATAQSIGTLAKMANEMRQSVSGFTLPDTNSEQA